MASPSSKAEAPFENLLRATLAHRGSCEQRDHMPRVPELLGESKSCAKPLYSQRR